MHNQSKVTRPIHYLLNATMLSELFQKQYDFELDQRNSIASATNIPIVAITVVASATCAILVDFQYDRSSACYAFVACAALAIVSFGYSVFCLFRSFWNYEYQKLPGASLLKSHFDSLKIWHLNEGCSANVATENATSDFADYLDERLAAASDWNSQNNIRRGSYLHKAAAAVATAVVFLLPAGAIYIHNKATAADKVHAVKVVNTTLTLTKEATMATTQSSGGNNQPTTAPATPAAPATTTTTTAKPSGPPNTFFKSDVSTPKPNASNNKK